MFHYAEVGVEVLDVVLEEVAIVGLRHGVVLSVVAVAAALPLAVMRIGPVLVYVREAVVVVSLVAVLDAALTVVVEIVRNEHGLLQSRPDSEVVDVLLTAVLVPAVGFSDTLPNDLAEMRERVVLESCFAAIAKSLGKINIKREG